MKKFVFIFLVLLFTPFAQAQTETYIELKNVEDEVNRLDITCFEQSTSISSPDQNTIKIQSFPNSNIFFVQDKKILPYKTFDYGEEKAVNYKILKLSKSKDDSFQEQFLFDGNKQTSIEFDPYSQYPKEILIDTKEILRANSSRVKLHYQGQVSVQYFISINNKKYVEVNNPEKFDFRYLQIVFEKSPDTNTSISPLIVEELRLTTPGKTTYLLNPINQKEITIYDGYQCQLDDNFYKLTRKLLQLSNKTGYSLSTETKQYDIEMKENSQYNSDFDSDSLKNREDNCPFDSNVDQKDIDGDLVGDVCDYDNKTKNPTEFDSDYDDIGNSIDNCPYIYNPKQIDSNADKHGDLCMDDDQDTIIGHLDNCMNISNKDQKDINVNGIGDACEFDKDQDGVFDSIDNCINLNNPTQKDIDNDGIGDICDNCDRYNPRQIDRNNNNQGDVCEDHEKYLQEHDSDEDTIVDSDDNCPKISNIDQKDIDEDTIGDACDNCLNIQNTSQEDQDKNQIGDLCEDTDNDGIQGYLDNCINQSNKNQEDKDNDNIGDACEDDDYDNILAAEDNCPFDSNYNQWDNDNDGIGDVCDTEDNRFVESNKSFLIAFISFISIIFGALIIFMIRKLKL